MQPASACGQAEATRARPCGLGAACIGDGRLLLASTHSSSLALPGRARKVRRTCTYDSYTHCMQESADALLGMYCTRTIYVYQRRGAVVGVQVLWCRAPGRCVPILLQQLLTSSRATLTLSTNITSPFFFNYKSEQACKSKT